MPTYEYDVNLTWPGPGAPGVNVWHIRTAGVNPGTLDLQDAVDALQTFYQGICASGVVPNGWVASGSAQAMDVADRSLVDVATWSENSDSQVPEFSGPSMVCVGLRTTSATRSGRGRKFIGPVSAQVCSTNGTINDTVLAAVRSAANDLVASSTAANDWAIGVYSQSSSLLRDVTAMPVRDVIATLRSRRD